MKSKKKTVELDREELIESLIKARSPENNQFEIDVGKAVTKDWYGLAGTQGFYDRTHGMTFEFFREIVRKSSVISAIIVTYCNKVSTFTQPALDGENKGFRIVPKNKKKQVTKILEEITKSDSEDTTEGKEPSLDDRRKAERIFQKKTQPRCEELTEFINNCGSIEDRPFYSQKWNFNAAMKAIVRDSLTFDQLALELVPTTAGKNAKGNLDIHHFYPIDAGTIRFASPELKRVANRAQQVQRQMPSSFLFEEPTNRAVEPLVVDEEAMENQQYRYVQVVRGQVAEVFKEDEIAFGIRNQNTDLSLNGYPVCELETLIRLIGDHLNTEQYRGAYYKQGFSAKGILHIKSDLSRAKLEEVRRQWTHMLKGSRNFFQTPIMAGVDGIDWIKLDQSDGNIEYSSWLNYLVRMISAVYQMDPSEWGYNVKDEGGSGGGLSGDNTKQKLDQSKNKGFLPLMIFLQEFINKQILGKIDPDFEFEWVGLHDEDPAAKLDRQQKESAFKKTVNEIRAESNLEPLKGCDDLILSPTYLQFLGMQQAKEDQKNQAAQGQPADGQPPADQSQNPEADEQPAQDPFAELTPDQTPPEEPTQKSRKMIVEVFHD